MTTVIKFKRFKAFGWTVTKRSLSKGQKYSVTYHVGAKLGRMKTLGLWAKGLVTGVNAATNEPVASQQEGLFWLDRGEDYFIPAGEYHFTCQEDADWWCVDRVSTTLHFEPIRLDAGADLALNVGDMIFMCDGSFTIDGEQIVPPLAFKVGASGKTLHAETKCYGYKFLVENLAPDS
jgi:hypothetical protein